MGVVNTKQVLSDLYGLMMEINLHRTDEDVLANLRANPDEQINSHLLKIKRLTAKLKAHTNSMRFAKAVEQIRLLKQKGLDEIKKLIRPEEQVQLVPLFRKFEDLSEEDEASILEDQQLLHLIEILKDRLDEDSEQ
jgi:hypothetical protein